MQWAHLGVQLAEPPAPAPALAFQVSYGPISALLHCHKIRGSCPISYIYVPYIAVHPTHIEIYDDSKMAHVTVE